jgi:hypothetical protein
MTRTEILTRYRRLRQISKELHQAVLDVIAPNVVLGWAKRLGPARGRTVLLESEQDMTLAEDLAIYQARPGRAGQARPGRSHPLDRYARAARLAPGSDETIVLEAMRQAHFSLWRVERRHGIMGLVLRDLLRGEDIWLADEALEKSARPGLEVAARLLKSEGFAMTARSVVPVTPALMEEALMEEAFARAPALRRVQGDALARDPHFAIGIYQAAVATGAMESVRFKRG